jgi:hypothetical protein
MVSRCSSKTPSISSDSSDEALISALAAAAFPWVRPEESRFDIRAVIVFCSTLLQINVFFNTIVIVANNSAAKA